MPPHPNETQVQDRRAAQAPPATPAPTPASAAAAGPKPLRRRTKPKKKKTRLWRRIFNLLLFAFFLLAIQAMVVAYIGMQYFKAKAAQFDLTALDRVPVSSLFFDSERHELWRSFTENRVLLPHDQIPDLMREAVISIEDERFYEHGGIDFTGMARAMVRNLKTKRFSQGGSTLSQQLAKHLMGDFSKTIDRKATEAFLALRIESRFTKEQILDYYLNRVYFGSGNYGISAAAQGYFGKPAKDLTAGECAMLAGIISAPNYNSPRNSMRRATDRRNIVLGKMVDHGYLTPAQAKAEEAKPIKLIPRKSPDIDRYAVQAVIKELRRILDLPDDESIPPGYRIYTTINKRLDDEAQKDIAKALARIEKQSDNKLDPENPLQGAGIVAEAKTGAVRVLVGGREYSPQKSFDRATQATPEIGAILQPILYLLAFRDLGLHPASMLNASFLDLGKQLTEEQLDLGDPNKDLAKRFLTVHDALALGHPAPAVRVAQQLDPLKVREWLGLVGIAPGKDAEIGAAFGKSSLWDVVQLYQVLANRGVYQKLYLIESVVKDNDEIVYQHNPEASRRQVIDPLLADQMTLTLQSAAREGRARSLWTDLAFPSPAAGMVGYSVGYRDALFAGYTPSLVGAAWVGYDKTQKIGSKEMARRAAIPIWDELVREVLKFEPKGAEFKAPEELTKVEANRGTGVVEGLGFLQPGPGNIFVYLKQSQIDQTQREAKLAAAAVQQPEDWSSWLGTMFAEGGEDKGLSIDDDERSWKASDIPPVVWFRMPALRGEILASDGQPLATTVQSQNLVIAWPSLEEAPTEELALAWMYDKIAKASQWLKRPVEIPDADLRSFYKYKRFNPLTVATNLTQTQIQAFPESTLSAEGFHLQGVPLRIYPHGPMAAHSLGWLKRTQGTSRGPFLADEVIYDAYTGDKGLEQIFDAQLTGKEGKITMKMSPEGFAERIFINEPASVGNNIRTTINFRLQQIVEKYIDEKHTAAVVVLDPNNGDVLAAASRPTFNPNDFVPALDPALWQAYTTAKRSPLQNRVFAQHNPPGSTFKVLTAIAAMNAGVFDPNRVVNCPGYFVAGNFTFQLGHERGSVSFRRAMARSFNTYFMDLGLRAGRDIELATSREWGFGEPTGIIFPGELPGLVSSPEYILKTHRRNMSKADLANVSIGQGDMLCTPLQLANFFAAVANGGTLYVPRIVKDVETPEGDVIEEFPTRIKRVIAIHEEEMGVLRDALLAVTTEGTAHRVAMDGIPVGAKTGTAQVGSKSRPRQIAWLGGFLPLDKPEMAFAVMVEGTFEEDLHGGSDAGGLAGMIFKEYFGKNKKEKKTEKASGSSTASRTPAAAPTGQTAAPAAPPRPAAARPNPSSRPNRSIP